MGQAAIESVDYKAMSFSNWICITCICVAAAVTQHSWWPIIAVMAIDEIVAAIRKKQ